MEYPQKIMHDNVEYVRYDRRMDMSNISLIRTYSAGVHFGTLVKRNGDEVVLENARRLHYWEGACSLSQVAIDGVDLSKSRISVTVPEITLIGSIEIIPMSEKAAKLMMETEPWKK